MVHLSRYLTRPGRSPCILMHASKKKLLLLALTRIMAGPRACVPMTLPHLPQNMLRWRKSNPYGITDAQLERGCSLYAPPSPRRHLGWHRHTHPVYRSTVDDMTLKSPIYTESESTSLHALKKEAFVGVCESSLHLVLV